MYKAKKIEEKDMATRSTIWFQKENGLEGIYCHWDGHLSTNGEILNRCYNTPEKLQELINRGALSFLGESIDKTKFYNDGSGKYFVNALEDIAKFEEDYNYIFIDGNWFYYREDVKDIKPLAPALI
jgi:hypothetical protein